MDCRENIFTQIARSINDFTNHHITKSELYSNIITMVEIATEEERNEREKFYNELREWNNGDLVSMTNNPRPYSNYEHAKNML